MSTPLSNTSSYCTVAFFLQMNDARRVGQLLLDIGEQAEAEAILSGAGLPADSVVQSALDASSGEVESACMVAGRYTPTDLAALTGVSQKFLWSVIADLAMYRLLTRRKAELEPTKKVERAWMVLGLLQAGEMIFGLSEQQAASIPSDTFLKRSDLQHMQLATTQANRMFGDRANWERNRSDVGRTGW